MINKNKENLVIFMIFLIFCFWLGKNKIKAATQKFGNLFSICDFKTIKNLSIPRIRCGAPCRIFLVAFLYCV